MSRRTLIVVAAALTALTASALPQAQSARQQPLAAAKQQAPIKDSASFSAMTTAVLVDVVVRTRDGKPVTDLSARDFELREDDIVQEIGSFTRVSRGAGIGVNVGVRDPNPPTVVTPPSGPAPDGSTQPSEEDYPSVTAA